MYRHCIACLALASLYSCAASPVEPETTASTAGVAATAAEPAASAGEAQALAAPVPATSVDVKNFDGKTVCESITATGTRMVVEKRCYTASKNDKEATARAENTRLQMENLRRDEEMRQRMERDAEVNRQTASMRALFP